MEKFEYKGTEFNIVESFGTSDIEDHHKYQVKKTDRTIIKTIVPIFPLWVGNKIRWFKKTRVRYRLFISRRQDFDDGWSYQNYWTPWKHEFRVEKILN